MKDRLTTGQRKRIRKQRRLYLLPPLVSYGATCEICGERPKERSADNVLLMSTWPTCDRDHPRYAHGLFILCKPLRMGFPDYVANKEDCYNEWMKLAVEYPVPDNTFRMPEFARVGVAGGGSASSITQIQEAASGSRWNQFVVVEETDWERYEFMPMEEEA
jgi:hypothetical protein